MLHQEREQVELLGRQLDGLAGDRHLARLAVEGRRRRARARRGRGRALGAAEDRLDPRDELARRERLRHVVVGADLEPGDAVGLLVARGQHHDRHRRARADAPADVEAVDPGQADVEHDEANGVPLELDERVLARAHPDDAVAVATPGSRARAARCCPRPRRAARAFPGRPPALPSCSSAGLHEYRRGVALANGEHVHARAESAELDRRAAEEDLGVGRDGDRDDLTVAFPQRQRARALRANAPRSSR